MSEHSSPRGLNDSYEHNKTGPDYFAFYSHEVAELLLLDDFVALTAENSDPSKTTNDDIRNKGTSKHSYDGKGATHRSLFSDAVGAELSDFRKERLKVALRQSVVVLTREVNEMLDPVLAVRRIKSHLRCKQHSLSYSGEASSCKKAKMSSSSSSFEIPVLPSPVTEGSRKEDPRSEQMTSKLLEASLSKTQNDGTSTKCSNCQATKTAQWRTGPDGHKSLCNACGLRCSKKSKLKSPSLDQKRGETISGSNNGSEKEYREVNDDLQIILENDSFQVEQKLKIYSDEISLTLEHMEQQLEELLDIVMSKCRSMTLSEKQHLQKMIQSLPPKNLDRIVEIIQRHDPAETQPCKEIYVDLEKQDNVTLWRLYYYVVAVESARKLTE